MAWYDGMTDDEIDYALFVGGAPGFNVPGAIIEVPSGFFARHRVGTSKPLFEKAVLAERERCCTILSRLADQCETKSEAQTEGEPLYHYYEGAENELSRALFLVESGAHPENAPQLVAGPATDAIRREHGGFLPPTAQQTIEYLEAEVLHRIEGSRAAVLAERERCEQLFLLFAYDWWGEKIKDSSAEEAIVDMLKDIRGGAKPHARAVFNPADPGRRGLPTILLYDTEADFSHDTLQDGEAGGVSEEPVVNGSSMSISDKPSGSEG